MSALHPLVRRAVSQLLIDPTRLQASMLTLILRVSAGLGVVIYVPSAYFAVRHGMVRLAVLDTAALAAVLALLRFDRVPFRWRASSFCLVCYALGVGLLFRVGSVSQIYLFAFSVVTVLLLGLRWGLWAVGLSSVTMLAIGALGGAAPEMGIPNWHYDLAAWMVITINFSLVNVLLTLAVGAVLTAVKGALRREIAARLALGRERNLLELQIERMPLGYLSCDDQFRFTRWNPAAERLFGFAEAEVLGKHPFELIVPPASQDAVAAIFERLRAGSMDANGEAQNRTRSGSEITCEWRNTPLLDDAGHFYGLISLVQDVTDRKLLEGQLRQAQKMEAVGQLAGGVAHDFNNLLSVVLGYSDCLIQDLDDDARREDVEEIRRAGVRASDLTRQLLMFSRQQVVEPRVLDLNDVLGGVEKMLRRVVGEDVELSLLTEPSLGRIRADAGSIEQVVMNLAVNARDAMPHGGKLTMETANVALDEEYTRTHLGAKPGPYVMLSVSDTGTGIDKAVLTHIFEPFFTTKETGKGTGLGLSTVFGIVQQSGGSIWVYSEPGLGTTFKVYLPRIDAAADVHRPVVVPATLRGSETVLLVEDEEQVRAVARGILVRHGYTVIEARSPGEALLHGEQHVGPIHLLLTDVVMPQMSGPVLATRLARDRPEMRVLCMSGYTDDAAARHGVIASELAYLQKPLTVETLTRKVRAVLDAK